MAKQKPSETADENGAKSPFLQITKSLYLTLSPCAYNFPLEGLCAEHISPLLLSYYPPLQGVILSYSNPRMTETPDEAPYPSPPPERIHAKSIDEYGVSYVWLTCDFVVFRPQRGTVLEGEVTLQDESMLGFLCYNYFNAAIEKDKLPADWKWDGEQWQDRKGKPVNRKKVSFKVDDFEASGQDSISIIGTMV